MNFYVILLANYNVFQFFIHLTTNSLIEKVTLYCSVYRNHRKKSQLCLQRRALPQTKHFRR